MKTKKEVIEVLKAKGFKGRYFDSETYVKGNMVVHLAPLTLRMPYLCKIKRSKDSRPVSYYTYEDVIAEVLFLTEPPSNYGDDGGES